MHHWLNVFPICILCLEVGLLSVLRMSIVSHLPSDAIGFPFWGLYGALSRGMLNGMHFRLTAWSQPWHAVPTLESCHK